MTVSGEEFCQLVIVYVIYIKSVIASYILYSWFFRSK